MISDLIAVLAVVSILAMMMLILREYQRRSAPHPELVRKILHLSMGVVSALFPWIFRSVESVVLLAVITGGGLHTIKKVAALRERFGHVLCSVQRRSYGEVSFAAGVAILFALAHRDPLLFCVPMLVLATADSMSALVGVWYGRHKYTTLDGNKSAEGSLAFFLVSATVTLCFLLLLSEIDTMRAVVISLLIGGLVTLFEAAAWRGLDNLLIPLSTYMLLSIYIQLPLEALIGRLLAGSCLLFFTLLWRKRTSLNDAASLGACLSCYVFAVAGGWEWLVAPLTFLALHRWFLPQRYQRRVRNQSIYAVIAVASTGLFWLVLEDLGRGSFFFPFTLSFAANMSMVAVAHLRRRNVKRLDVPVVMQAVLGSWIIFFVPFIVIERFAPDSLRQALLALPWIALACTAFAMTARNKAEVLAGKSRWAKQTGITALLTPLSVLC